MFLGRRFSNGNSNGNSNNNNNNNNNGNSSYDNPGFLRSSGSASILTAGLRESIRYDEDQRDIQGDTYGGEPGLC